MDSVAACIPTTILRLFLAALAGGGAFPTRWPESAAFAPDPDCDDLAVLTSTSVSMSELDMVEQRAG